MNNQQAVLSRDMLFTQYLVLRGNVGFYTTNQQALVNAYHQDQRYILHLPNTYQTEDSLQRSLYYRLKDYIMEDEVIDIDKICSFFTISYYSESLKQLYYKKKKIIAYLSRRIEKDGTSKFAIILDHMKHSYCFVSPLQVNRGKDTDMAPFLKLKEITDKYNYHGILRVNFPTPYLQFWRYEINWKIEIYTPFNEPFQMKNLNTILKTGKPLSPVKFIN